MKRFDIRAIGGILLIVVGILLLLQNFGVLGIVVTLIWSLLSGAVGVVSLYNFLTNRAHWWTVILGLALLSLAALIALDEFFPRIGDALGGVIFLGAIGLAFWVVYFTNREHWWAIIPGGVMFTLALIAGLESVFEGLELGGVFFMGLGLTFALLYFVPIPQGRMKWALIPAAVLVVMGALITAAATGSLAYLGGAVLILVGLYSLLRLFVSR